MKTYTQLLEELALDESSRARKLHTRKMGGFRYGTGPNPVSTGKLLDAPSGFTGIDGKKIDKESVGRADPQGQKVYGIRQGNKETLMTSVSDMSQHLRPGYNPNDPKDVAATKLRATNTPEQEMKAGRILKLQKHYRLQKHK